MEEWMNDDLLDSMTMELRRGTIVLGVLSHLRKPQYGYGLVVALQEHQLQVDANTLYPLLRRLEKQELLVSSWDTDGSKPRKYYQLSTKGYNVLERLYAVWQGMQQAVTQLYEQEEIKHD
jgi:PadR family transcriptional regulator, regulatory protein PadR